MEIERKFFLMRYKNKRKKNRLVFVIVILIAGIFIYGIFGAPRNILGGDQAKIQQALNDNEKYINDKTGEGNNTTKSYKHLLAIGDSVMLGAAKDMMEQMPGITVDAKESRQLFSIEAILKKSKVGEKVIIGLGTNGVFDENTFVEEMDLLKDKKVYWINLCAPTTTWETSINETISEMGKKYDNLTIIDWKTEGSKHPKWFYEDQIHLNMEGRKGYAAFIKKSIDQ